MEPYKILRVSDEEFKKIDNIIFYAEIDDCFDEKFKLVCIEDRNPFYVENAVKAFVRYIRKRYKYFCVKEKYTTVVNPQLKCVFTVNQQLDYMRYIKLCR